MQEMEGFELLGTWQGASCSEIHDGDINFFSGYSITFGQAATLFSMGTKSMGTGEERFLAAVVFITQMSSAQMSPALSSKEEASGLGESSGGGM